MLTLLVYVIVVGAACWLLWWLVDFVGLPDPFGKVAKVIVAVFAVVFLLDTLFGITGVSPPLRLK